MHDRLLAAGGMASPQFPGPVPAVRAAGVRVLRHRPDDPFPGVCERRVFPGHEAELGSLRRWLAALLPDIPARDDVIVVAVELATNAVRHTASGHGGCFAVEVTWHARVAMLRVAVADCGGPTEPEPPAHTDPLSEHGRGLQMVRDLAARIGSLGDQRGRLMWADVRFLAATALPASALPAPSPPR